jgi:hypothetical protein
MVLSRLWTMMTYGCDKSYVGAWLRPVTNVRPHHFLVGVENGEESEVMKNMKVIKNLTGK